MRSPEAARHAAIRRAAISMCLAAVGTTRADVIFVDAGATGAGTGTSWVDAYVHLQDALAKPPQAGDEIWVAKGVYMPDGARVPDGGSYIAGSGSRTATFQLRNGVLVAGGLAGSEDPATFDLDDRDFETNETILSGDLNQDDVGDLADPSRDENSYNVLWAVSDPTTMLNGFTITGGNADGEGPYNNVGGGILNVHGGSVCVANCRFARNTADVSGGGMCNSGGTPTLDQCTFEENSAGNGGAIYDGAGSSPVLSDCVFQGNSSVGGGGAVFNQDGASPIVERCTFIGNTTAQYGGGIKNYPRCNVTLTDCAFIQNTAAAGAGVFNMDNAPALTRCTFTGNSATSYGGGMYNSSDSIPTLVACRFSNNIAGADGGAIRNDNRSSAILANCIFTGNAAGGSGGALQNSTDCNSLLMNCVFGGNEAGGNGGGMYNDHDSNPLLTNCTFLGNHADGSSGGVFSQYTSVPSLVNCILWGNTDGSQSGEFAQIHWSGADVPVVTYCCIEGLDTIVGVGNIGDEPFLAADGFPLPGSPCIDAGDTAALPTDAGDVDEDDDVAEPLPLDLDGTIRVHNGVVDMGAYEYDPLGDHDGDGAANSEDNCISAPNPNQEDTDTDNVGDACDVCQGFDDHTDSDDDDLPDGCDSCPEDPYNDIDVDGICGDVDNCPTDPNPDQPDVDGDGIGDVCDTIIPLFVDSSATGANNGSNWTDAYRELQAAFAAAQAGGEIWVAAGTYLPDYDVNTQIHTGDRYASFQLVYNLAIRGGFPVGGGYWQDRDPKAHKTILCGDLNGDDGSGFKNNGENSYHVVTAIGPTTNSTAILDGFTIIAGNANGDGMDSNTQCGGGMLNCDFSDPTVKNCVFEGNYAYRNGGGMFNYASGPLLMNCILRGNYAYGNGGAIAGMYGRHEMINCVVTGNVARGWGGGMDPGTGVEGAFFRDCVFSGNMAYRGAGGIYNSSGSTITVVNCIVWGNTAPDAPEIYNQGVIALSYSCIQGGYDGIGNIDTDPGFVRLPSDGGDGWGIGQNDDFGDLRFWAGSSCIDAGDNTAVPADTADLDRDGDTTERTPFDHNGSPRFMDDPAVIDTGVSDPPDYPGIVDMGAYEGYVPADTGPPTVPQNLTVDEVTSATVTLSWDASSDDVGVAGYRIYRNAVNVGISTCASYTDSGLSASTAYTYTVTAYDSKPNESNQSDPVQAATTEAKRIRVDASSPGGDGTTWATAYAYLQDALAVAQWGDEIWVAAGAYKPDQGGGMTPGDRAATFELVSGVAMYGGFPAGGGLWADRNPEIHATILTGDLNDDDQPGHVNRDDNSYHVVTAYLVDSSTVLDGFVVTRGHADDLTGAGGGIRNQNGSPIIVDCALIRNRAWHDGGGMLNERGNPVLVNCSFWGNSTEGCARCGGGLCNDRGNPTLFNCIFVGNTSRRGGAISNYYADALTLVNCSFSMNVAELYGGAIYDLSGNSTLTNCVFWGNTAPQGPQLGGWNWAVSVGYSDIQGGETDVHFGGDCTQNWGGGNIDADPGFVRLPSDGGDGWGTGENDDYGDLRFWAGSPCIDAGDNTAVPADTADLDRDGDTTERTPFDREGNPRFVDDPSVVDTGVSDPPDYPGIVDMGAYEGFVPADTGPPTVPQNLTVAEATTATVTLSWDASSDDVGVAGYRIYRNAVEAGISTGTSYTDSFLIPSTTYTYTVTAYDSKPNESNQSDPVQATTTEAVRIHVDASGPGGDGTTWETAFTCLQDALAVAQWGDEIWVAAGTYKPDQGGGMTPGDRAATFELVSGMAMYGGFPAGGGVWADRDSETHATILSGDLNDDDGSDFANYDENSYHIVTATGCADTTVLDGFMIVDANANNVAYGRYGGGILIQHSSSPMITDCDFIANKASDTTAKYGSGQGGGVYSFDYCSPKLTNCTFARNTAASGGGMYSRDSSVTLDKCTFRNNTATWGSAGGMGSHFSTMTVTDCTFVGNSCANSSGGGMLGAYGTQTLKNCIFVGNYSPYGGGAISCYAGIAEKNVLNMSNCVVWGNENEREDGGGIKVSNTDLTMANCILWGNYDSRGIHEAAQITWADGDTVDMTYCYVQGLETISGTGNDDRDPFLTPDWHLRSKSPCINAGDPAYSPDPGDTDVDGEDRVLDGRVDIGLDEFWDTDTDGLPDSWENEYPTAADPAGDPDGDGLTNLEEYERYSSNPVGLPIYVCNDCDPTPDGTIDHPYGMIQAGIDAAADGDTVLVLEGTYSGAGNRDLDYKNKSVIVRSWNGTDPAQPANVTIDCGDTIRAVNPDSVEGTFVVLKGFTIVNGHGDLGGGVVLSQSRLMLEDCVVVDSSATTDGGGIHFAVSNPTIGTLAIGPGNTAPAGKADAGVIQQSNLNLLGNLTIEAGRLDVLSSWFYGPGGIDLAPNTWLSVTGTPGAPPTVLHAQISGLGDILIEAGQQLTLDGGAVVDLSGGAGGSCANGCVTTGDPSEWGTITIDGTLLVRDATIRNTNVEVTEAEIGPAAGIIYNDIRMPEATAGFGGQFFVESDAHIECNTIYSTGDRYLDYDPDPEDHNLNICHNTIHVEIIQGVDHAQGTVLELRALDYDCGTPTNPDCHSGAFAVAGSEGFTADSSANWVVETLAILPDAKLNLTNRSGFQYQADTTHPETVYVRHLVLHPNAVLNTALQTLYYEALWLGDGSDEPANWTAWSGGGPPYPDPLLNGARIVDQPLLGFSLAIIAMDDDTPPPHDEFTIRVRKRLRDPADEQDCRCDGTCPDNDPPKDPTTCKEGSIERLCAEDVQLEIPELDDVGGVMDMRTRAVDRQQASSVAAKGAFARAGDEDITIAFDYLFRENPNAELVVYLSDDPDVGVRSFEVARVRPPEAGRPGALGSGKFGVFYSTYPRVTPEYTLNFTRGTYVELELRGQDARVWIDNFDPRIECIACSDLNGTTTVDNGDYLLLLAEYGQAIPLLEAAKFCLDSRLSNDNYVDVLDLLGWDAYLSDPLLNACGTGLPDMAFAAEESLAQAETSDFVANALVIAGKPSGSGQQADYLYPVSLGGESAGEPQAPAAGTGTRSNGRLVRDKDDTLYQLHATQGLLRIGDEPLEQRRIVSPQIFDNFEGNKVYVGITELGWGDFVGLPIADAAFHPTDSSIVYVLPVVVDPQNGNCAYRAAAKLQITGDGTCNLLMLYGRNPAPESSVWGGCDLVFEPDVQRLRELEVDANGKLYVTTAQALNSNDWLLIYDEAVGNASEQRVNLSSIVPAPTAMRIAPADNKMYLASSVNSIIDPATGQPGGQANIYRFVLGGPQGLTPDGVIAITYPVSGDVGYGYVSTITSMIEHAGKLYAVGFNMPRFDPDKPYDDPEFDPATGAIPATPTLAVIDLATGEPELQTTIGCPTLGLPLSVLYVPGTTSCPADLDGDSDVDLADFSVFAACFNGPNRAPAGACAVAADFDNDNDVDLADFAEFAACFNGPNRSPAAGCPS